MIKWEEKNYIEQEKSFLNNSELEEIDITTNTLKKSKSKECKNTGWTRNCPMCNKIIAYKRKWSRNDAEKRKLLCTSCVKRKQLNLTRECPKCGTPIHYKDGSKLNRAVKENRVCSDCKKKMFVKIMAEKAKQCGNRSFFPNYNKIACEYFEWLNKFMGWNGQYATHGGEKNVLNYFLDYYEPIHNIVVEWDEQYHNRKKQKNLDIKRQAEIKKFLGCKFYRHNDLTGELKEV